MVSPESESGKPEMPRAKSLILKWRSLRESNPCLRRVTINGNNTNGLLAEVVKPGAYGFRWFPAPCGKPGRM